MDSSTGVPGSAGLFLIGSEFGEVISAAESAGKVLGTALTFALLATLIPCGLIFATRPRPLAKVAKRESYRWTRLWLPLRECIVPTAMVSGLILTVPAPIAITTALS
ncbi:hypothetical protein [Arthrobacter sp. RAF14]|uniref:hypothetical protein n=1 Tax=Arthrobacter sp. RAF14 TaxID=3233051 RepID=UPI003F91D608